MENQQINLNDNWQQGLEILNASQLKEQGNPLYVLPWYLMIGSTGCGKTSALQYCKVASPMEDSLAQSGSGDTLGWRFLDTAVILKSNLDEQENSQNNWQQLSELICNQRKEKPLEGMLITISLQEILNSSTEQLEQKAKFLRTRIDELIKISQTDFPIYMLFTKIDAVDGFNDFFAQLNENGKKQFMGALNSELEQRESSVDFFSQQLTELLNRIQKISLPVLPQSQAPEKVFIFPQNLTALKNKLQTFVKNLFSPNPYQNTPFLRGFFFTSAQNSEKSFFLNEIFALILPKDKNISQRTQQRQQKSQRTRLIMLSFWIVACLVVAGLLTASFARNWSVLQNINTYLKSKPALGQEKKEMLTWLEQVRSSIDNIYTLNRKIPLPNLGLAQGLKMEEKLRYQYVEDMHILLLNPVDEKIQQNVKSLLASQQQNNATAVSLNLEQATRLAKHVDTILDRIQLLESALKNNQSKFPTEIQPDYEFMSSFILKRDKNTGQIFAKQHLAYLRWQVGPQQLQQQLKEQKALLSQILSQENLGLDWLTTWVNQRKDMRPIRLNMFWGNDLQSSVHVPAAYTQKGWQGISQMLSRIQELAINKQRFTEIKTMFLDTYWSNYQQNWKDFLDNFSQGEKIYSNLEARLESSSMLLGPDSPYAKVLMVAGKELKLVQSQVKDQALRPWLVTLYAYLDFLSPKLQQAYLQATQQQDKNNAPGFFKRALSSAQKIMDGLENSTQLSEQQLQIMQLLIEFDNQLQQISQELKDDEKCFAAATEAFKDDKTSQNSKSAVLKAYWNVLELKKLLGQNSAREDIFWNIFQAPLLWGWQTELNLTGKILQASWEKDVLAETAELEGWKKVQALLFNPKSFFWEFVRGPVENFLQKDKKGEYSPRKVLSQSVPFTPEFITMITGGKRSRQFLLGSDEGTLRVLLETRPTDVNKGAKLKITRSELSLYCGGQVQTQENLNFPASTSFAWTPGKCNKVRLRFEAHDLLEVEKSYTGVLAFPEFIDDLEKGRGRTRYSAKELKVLRGSLKKYKIKDITVKFRVSDQKPVLQILRNAPKSVPEYIVQKQAR